VETHTIIFLLPVKRYLHLHETWPRVLRKKPRVTLVVSRVLQHIWAAEKVYNLRLKKITRQGIS